MPDVLGQAATGTGKTAAFALPILDRIGTGPAVPTALVLTPTRELAIQVNTAVRDYGQALRDLATSNIFPGDLLIKNFGVTANRRVVFYDYDELCEVTDCRFRDVPPPRSPDEEMANEAWFYVGENDIFPEELLQFLGLSAPHRELFREEHGEVLTAAFWRELQGLHNAGAVLDVFPYPRSKRLR